MRILIDVGHGGSDPGAINGTRYEKSDTLKASLKLGDMLKTAGHTVDFTRTIDCSLSLAARSYMENQGNYDLLVSFHRDSFTNASANGVTVYVYTGYSNKNDGQFAKKVADQISREGNLYNRGVKEANFHMLRETKCTAILIECGFISNADDNVKFDQRLENICFGTATGICSIAGGTVGPTYPPTTPNVPQAKYRVKVNGVQVGAYSNLDNAKKVADERKGIIEDMGGNKVYPFNPDTTDEKYRYAERGTFYPNTTINFRNAPKVSSDTPVQGQYNNGESVNYDTVVIGERYNWISWVSAASGYRRYMPIRDKKTGEAMWGYAI